jgi:hypothetical protein
MITSKPIASKTPLPSTRISLSKSAFRSSSGCISHAHDFPFILVGGLGRARGSLNTGIQTRNTALSGGRENMTRGNLRAARSSRRAPSSDGLTGCRAVKDTRVPSTIHQATEFNALPIRPLRCSPYRPVENTALLSSKHRIQRQRRSLVRGSLRVTVAPKNQSRNWRLRHCPAVKSRGGWAACQGTFISS